MGIEKVEGSLAILLNGPASCGKGVVVDYLKGQGYDFEVKSCKDKLHTLTREFFCVSEERYLDVYSNRCLKEMPLLDFRVTIPLHERDMLEVFLGYSIQEDSAYRNHSLFFSMKYPLFTVNLSIREALIYMSEVVVKPRVGSAYFGVARALSVQANEIIVDDSTAAFYVNGEIKCDEVEPLLDRIGAENTLLLRIHRDGFTFEGDSREYVPDGVVPNTVDIYNNGTEHEYYLKVEEVVNDFIKQRSR